MRFNRFVFLNRPMLSLETHLGVIASPQAPFPADFVTLPVSASHRRFGSFPLVAGERQSRQDIECCIPDMLKQRTSFQPRCAGRAYYTRCLLTRPDWHVSPPRLAADTGKSCVLARASTCSSCDRSLRCPSSRKKQISFDYAAAGCIVTLKPRLCRRLTSLFAC